MDSTFSARKQQVLVALSKNEGDRSPKGNVDAPIVELIEVINKHTGIYTTSSCSGRVTVFAEPIQNQPGERKRVGKWVYITHDPAVLKDVEIAVTSSVGPDSRLVFRFEPFILHVECCSIQVAQQLMHVAKAAGFRESGIMGGRRIVAAVRCSLRLEVPISHDSQLLVPGSYLAYLVDLANTKFAENLARVHRFQEMFQQQMLPHAGGLLGGAPQQLNGEGMSESEGGLPASAQGDGLEEKAGPSETDGEGGVELGSGHVVTVRAAGGKVDVDAGGKQQEAAEKEPYSRKARRAAAAARKGTAAAGPGDATGMACTVVMSAQALLRRQQALLRRLWSCEEEVARRQLLCSSEQPAFLPMTCCCSRGFSSDALFRWGHSTVAIGQQLLVFGGFGGVGAQSRRNDVLSCDLETAMWREVQAAGERPAPRMGHVAVAVGSDMVVLGGRASPECPFGDVWLFQTESSCWRQIFPTAAEPWQPRFRHSAVYHPASRRIYVLGGKVSGEQSCDELWALQVGSSDQGWEWQQLTCSRDPPCARSSHAAALLGSDMYVFGGTSSYSHIFGDMFRLHIPTLEWTRVDMHGGAAPPACFSHSLSAVPFCGGDGAGHSGYLVLLGGYPAGAHNHVHVFDVQSRVWTRLDVRLPREFVPIRHTATVVDNRIHIVGGGTLLYGSVFSPPHTLHLPASNAPTSCCSNADSGIHQQATASGIKPEVSPDLRAVSPHVLAEGGECPGSSVLLVAPAAAKGVKDALRACGWLDRALKAGVAADGGQQRVRLPLTPEGARHVAAMAGANDVGGSVDGPVALADALRQGLAALSRAQLASNPKVVRTPQDKLREAAVRLLTAAGHTDEQVQQLCQELPGRWEKLGDLALIPQDSMTSSAWWLLGQGLWACCAEALQVERLARQAHIANTGTRDSQAELLYGADGWVRHRENGVTFILDVTRCMFSSGNVTERTRIGRTNMRGETVVDLYAGAGYYTLPALVGAGAAKVYACEWNPHALEALRRGLAGNFVSARCEVLPGDCRQVAPRAVAHRVLLGLLPSSEGGWQTALAALRPEGGWLHVHQNVLAAEEREWVAGAVERLRALAQQLGRSWQVLVQHVERVKWYAPHVRHIVVDVLCTPATQQPNAAAQLAVATSTASATAHVDGRPNGHTETGQSQHSTPHMDPHHPTGGSCLALATQQPSYGSVRVVEGVTAQQFQEEYAPQRQPLILRGLDLGPCRNTWGPAHFGSCPSATMVVSAHVCRDPSGAMDFLNRNFEFKTMPLAELAARCAEQPDADAGAPSCRYYLRSVGANPRKERADFAADFPDLAAELNVPPLFPPERAFSSVLRISSPGLRLWTHYDVMDNVLLHICGRKTVVLWPPSEEGQLYMQGSSSAVIDIEAPDPLRFPLFPAARSVRCELLPGDVLFIPALWFHNVLSQEFSVSVNVFWRELEDPELYERKDLYGNRDPVPANAADAAIDEAMAQLQQLPCYYRDFYRARLVRKMQAKA